jgi:hypothetical protein
MKSKNFQKTTENKKSAEALFIPGLAVYFEPPAGWVKAQSNIDSYYCFSNNWLKFLIVRLLRNSLRIILFSKVFLRFLYYKSFILKELLKNLTMVFYSILLCVNVAV